MQARATLTGAGSDRASRVLAAGLTLLAISVIAGKAVPFVALSVALAAAIAAWHESMLRWPTLVAVLVSVILFVPIGRYSLPLNLPFEFELYRLVVALVLTFWAASLLVDPRVRLRRTPFDIPLAVILVAIFGSLATNLGRVTPLDAAVLKAVTFFVSFVLVYYFVVSVMTSRRTIERLIEFLVLGTAVVAVFSIVEQRTRFNVFDHLSPLLPILQFNGALEVERYGVLRAVASSSNPIALGVLFAMVFPLSLAFVFSASRLWWIPTAVIFAGALAPVSRTPLFVLGAGVAVLLWLRPRDIKGLLPLLIPAIVLVKLMLPGSIATLKEAFFPQGGIVQEASRLGDEADPLLAGGRVRQLGPSLREASRTPLFGQGYATRQTGFNNPLRNAPILDNQWLGLLLELGLVGVVGFAALFFGAVRQLGRASRRRAGPDGWLAAGLAAALAGFAVGMFTYDSFAFIQVTFVLWLLFALAASLLLAETAEAH